MTFPLKTACSSLCVWLKEGVVCCGNCATSGIMLCIDFFFVCLLQQQCVFFGGLLERQGCLKAGYLSGERTCGRAGACQNVCTLHDGVCFFEGLGWVAWSSAAFRASYFEGSGSYVRNTSAWLRRRVQGSERGG